MAAASPKKSKQMIAYVHEMSATSTTAVILQTSSGPQPAMVYSPNKRKLLLEKQKKKRAPVKIPKYSTTPDGKKVIINDMSTITTPLAEEYNFQYAELPAAPSLHVKEILDNFEEYKEITVKGKVSGLGDIRHPKGLSLSSGHLSDDYGTIPLDVWEKYIPQLVNGHVYTISPVKMRSYKDVLKITTIKDKTKIKEVFDSPELANLPETDSDESDDLTTKYVDQIYSIDKIEKFLKCNKCFKKILQVNNSLAHCDNCGQRARISNCDRDIRVKVVLEAEDGSSEESLHLTAFAQSLLSVMPNILQMEDNDIADKLMELERITFTYDMNSSVVSKLSITDINTAAFSTAV